MKILLLLNAFLLVSFNYRIFISSRMKIRKCYWTSLRLLILNGFMGEITIYKYIFYMYIVLVHIVSDYKPR